MARVKRNRCRVKSCSVIISPEYFFCYMHRKWSLSDVQESLNQLARAEAQRPAKPRMLRFFCDPCGTVWMAPSYTKCQMCGSKTEALDEMVAPA